MAARFEDYKHLNTTESVYYWLIQLGVEFIKKTYECKDSAHFFNHRLDKYKEDLDAFRASDSKLERDLTLNDLIDGLKFMRDFYYILQDSPNFDGDYYRQLLDLSNDIGSYTHPLFPLRKVTYGDYHDAYWGN